ncbi:MAG TPA: OmpA family protein, partial [Myxococcaceae bacterium]|nr:OmpA family protein [Myxococcaceae bacterium]
MSAQRGAAARLVWVLGFWAAAAWADAVEVDLSAKAELGKGLPTLEVHIMEPIAGFKVELRRSDGQPFSARGGGNPGVMRRIPLPQPEGAFSYHGELTVNFPDASTAALPLKFDTELWGPLRIELSAADVDLTARRLAFKLNRPAAKAELQVLADTG